MTVRRNITMSCEALCSCTTLDNMNPHPGRRSPLLSVPSSLDLLAISFMLSQWQFLSQISFFFPSETQPANCRNHLSGFKLSPLAFSSPILPFPLISSSTSLLGFHLRVITQFHILISTLRRCQFSHTPPQNPSYSYSPLLPFFPLVPTQLLPCLFIPSFHSSVPNPLFYFPPQVPFTISLPIRFPTATSQAHRPCPSKPLSFFFFLTWYESMCWCTLTRMCLACQSTR